MPHDLAMHRRRRALARLSVAVLLLGTIALCGSIRAGAAGVGARQAQATQTPHSTGPTTRPVVVYYPGTDACSYTPYHCFGSEFWLGFFNAPAGTNTATITIGNGVGTEDATWTSTPGKPHYFVVNGPLLGVYPFTVQWTTAGITTSGTEQIDAYCTQLGCEPPGPDRYVDPCPPPTDDPVIGITSGNLGSPGQGYETTRIGGESQQFGNAFAFQATAPICMLAHPAVGAAATPDGLGSWVVASDGGVFTFGDAGFFGSTGALTLNKPIVGMAPTPDGGGYWLVASDGGVFAFGDAAFYGSSAALALNMPVIAIVPTLTGHGYTLAAADGGSFNYGDATYPGLPTGGPLDAPAVAAAPDGSGGYWLVTAGGQVVGFGGATPLPSG